MVVLIIVWVTFQSCMLIKQMLLKVQALCMIYIIIFIFYAWKQLLLLAHF